VTIKSITLKCDITIDWIKLPELAETITEIKLRVNVPQNAKDNTCFVTLVITDNDKTSPKETSE
jgi:hypothetical protein